VSPDRRLLARRGRVAAGVGLSLAAHACILFALIWTRLIPLPSDEPRAVVVQLVAERPPVPPAPPAPKPKPKPATNKPAAPKVKLRPPPPHEVETLPVAAGRAVGTGMWMTDAQLAGAASAGGGGGGACDMARRVQEALRKDPLVRNAVVPMGGRAVMVWNGDWVQSNGEDGKGLAAVREAVMWEVGFAPAACRAEPVRGLIVFSMGAGPGSPRLVMGMGQWRWSDLLTRGPTVSEP